MEKLKTLFGKILFGILFIIIVPTMLILWAKYTNNQIELPAPENSLFGYILIFLGLFLIFGGIINLWFYGNGLPMNAFPPKKFVKKGIYSFIKNPIYTGCMLLSFGISVIAGSSSGFWLVSPIFTVMIIAYIFGFEKERTENIFGKQQYKTFSSLPEVTNELPNVNDRISAYFLTYIPCLIIYATFAYIGTPKDALIFDFPINFKLPYIQFTLIFYIFTYISAIFIPFIINSKSILRSFVVDIWFSIIFTSFIYFVFPVISVNDNYYANTVFCYFASVCGKIDNKIHLLPSIYIILTFVFIRYLAIRFRKIKWFLYFMSVLVVISSLTTAIHTLSDIFSGILIFLVIVYRIQIWNLIRKQSEHLANSWKEWHFGSIRLINHGFYAGAAGFVGIFIINSILVNYNMYIGFIIALFGIIGAGLWAQIIEGSSKLQRPYGYYGSVVGVLIGSIFMAFIFNINIFILFASFAMAAPWVQILGRLRCLAQGCCHGKPCEEWLGIKFIHPLSRVNKISGLTGKTLHPTQLYSITTNIITGLILIRLYNLNFSATFLVGIYLIFNGLGRFIEESLRGEAQTPYWSGMRIYQWIAIINIIIGCIFTCLPIIAMPEFQLTLYNLYWATGMGIIAIFAYGVDFPNSNKRFARLTSK